MGRETIVKMHCDLCDKEIERNTKLEIFGEIREKTHSIQTDNNPPHYGNTYKSFKITGYEFSKGQTEFDTSGVGLGVSNPRKTTKGYICEECLITNLQNTILEKLLREKNNA